ncbi:MAG TPA: recombinase family protein [Candidatus Acidoferrales bacterium]|nr:recombinase family protein [Candidatus Acidoferrales bacterium]
MIANPTICGLYTRVSSRNQAETEYSSLETQRERLEAYCHSQENYTIHRVYEDGGYSADSLDRPALKQMLRDIREGKLNCILAYKIDRLTRSVKDFHQLMELFDRYGVKFVSVTQSLDTQNPMGRLLRNILLDFAQFEREMTADRTRDKMYQRAQKGLWNGGNVPYGYAVESKKLVVNPEEAPRVRFMFQRFADNPSLSRLREELHRRGWYARSQKPWSKSALDMILRNPVYCGCVRFNEHRFKGEHQPVIEEPLFVKAKSLRRDRGHCVTKQSRVFLLKGLIRCSDCGSWMTPHYTQKKHKDGSVYRVPYYRCTKTMHFDNSVCHVKHVNADHIEHTVVQKLSELSQNEAYLKMSVEELNRDLREKAGPLEKEAGQIKRRIEEIEREITRYVKALGQGKLSVERLEEEIASLEASKRTFQIEYDGIQRKINETAMRDFNAELLQRTLQDFRNVFDSLIPSEQTEALQCLVKSVTVHPEKLDLEIFELEEFRLGSQNRSEWLPGLDSN